MSQERTSTIISIYGDSEVKSSMNIRWTVFSMILVFLEGEIMPETEVTQEKLISAKALAKMLSVSQRTVWRLVSSGGLPDMVSLGGSKRFRMSDVTMFIECGCDMTVYRARK